MSDISVERVIEVLQDQARIADLVAKERPEDSPETRINLRQHAKTIRTVLQNICEDLNLDVRGVNLPWSECEDCGGEDGDHEYDCPADKLAALDKRF